MISAGLVTHKGTLPIFFYDPCFRKDGFRLDTKKIMFNLNIMKQRQQSGESGWLLKVGLALTTAVLGSRLFTIMFSVYEVREPFSHFPEKQT